MKKILTLIILLIFTGCVRESYNISNQKIPTDVEIIPFVNLTQTPMAGYKVASIVNGVMKTKGYNVKLFGFSGEEYTPEEINTLLNKADKRYIITGYVNEYRYRTGIDGEPASSVTIKVYDKKEHKYIYTSTFSITGDTYNSLGVITQEAINNVIKNAQIDTKNYSDIITNKNITNTKEQRNIYHYNKNKTDIAINKKQSNYINSKEKNLTQTITVNKINKKTNKNINKEQNLTKTIINKKNNNTINLENNITDKKKNEEDIITTINNIINNENNNTNNNSKK